MSERVAIVTGAANGIGRGIAHRLAQDGLHVVVSDLDQEACQAVVDEIEEEKSVRAHAVACDVSQEDDVDHLIAQTLERFGHIDVLVNNAGIYPSKPFGELTLEDWERVNHVNLRGVFLTCRKAVGHMPDHSKIINISSIAAQMGFHGLVHYSATKGGVDAFTRGLALELGDRHINVNAVAPGAIKTPGTDKMDDATHEQMKNAIPWHRWGTPEDIAGAVSFLASSDADYMTGQVLTVDGGWTLQ